MSISLTIGRSLSGSELPPPPERPGAVVAFPCAVVGESHDNPDGSNRQDLIRQWAYIGQPVMLRREPDNPHDRNAIAVLCSGWQIGYLKREVAERLCDRMDDQAFRVEAHVRGIHGGTGSKPSLGVTLDLGVYETGLPSNSPWALQRQADEAGLQAREAAKAGEYEQARHLYEQQGTLLRQCIERAGADAPPEAEVFAPLHLGMADLLRLEKRHDDALPHILYWVIAGRRKPLKGHAEKLRAYFNRCKLQNTVLDEAEHFAAAFPEPAEFTTIETQVRSWLDKG